nr:hypothetical protein [Candidatus Gracilibacteria bacterium]
MKENLSQDSSDFILETDSIGSGVLGVEEIMNLNFLEKLATSLGFVETSGMRELRHQMYVSKRSKEKFSVLHERYVDLARINLENNLPEGQISIILMEAILYYENGNITHFKENINTALTYSEYINREVFNGINDIYRKLKKN